MKDSNHNQSAKVGVGEETSFKKLLTKKNLLAGVFVVLSILFLSAYLYLQNRQEVEDTISDSVIVEDLEKLLSLQEEEGVEYLGKKYEPRFRYNANQDQWYFVSNIDLCSGEPQFKFEPIDVEGTLSPLDGDYIYFRDDQNVFFVDTRNKLDMNHGEYPTYNCNGLYRLHVLDGADVNTFESFYFDEVSGVVTRFARDSKNVFIGPTLLPDSDPSTFRLLDKAKFITLDKNQVYFYYQIPIPKADPSTFSVIANVSLPIGSLLIWSKDANNVFFNECVVEGADAETVRLSRHSLIDKYGEFTVDFNVDPKEGTPLLGAEGWHIFPWLNYDGYKNCVRERKEVEPWVGG